MYTIPFEWDTIALTDWMASNNGDHSVMYEPEGQLFLEHLRRAIEDYQKYVRGGRRALEAGEYHGKHDSGKYIKNVKWWLFDEHKPGERYCSELPFETVCEFLDFNPQVVRESIERLAREAFINSQQIHRRTNSIKGQEPEEVAIRARNDLPVEGGNNHACRTITGKT